MGQGTSVDQSLADLKHHQGKLQAHISVLGHLATLTYDEFIKSVEDLNKITSTFSDNRGKQLQFVVKKGTDDTFLWKATVRIRCYKFRVLNEDIVIVIGHLCCIMSAESADDRHQINTRTKSVDSCRSLTLRQYALMHREISEQVSTLSNLQSPRDPEVTASAIFNDFNAENVGEEDENECCICMERKAEVILGCGHNFCEICIDSWTSDKTRSNCPLCREKVAGSDDTWVLTEKPDSSDYETDLKGYLVGLADRP